MNNNRITPYLEALEAPDPDGPTPYTLAPQAVNGHAVVCQQVAPELRKLHKPGPDAIIIKRHTLILLRLDLEATRAAAEKWQQRAEAAEAELKRRDALAVRRVELDDVTVHEITPAHAHWLPMPAPRLTLLERVWLFFTEGRA